MVVAIDTDTLDVNGLARLALIMPKGKEQDKVYELYDKALELCRCPRCRVLFGEGDRYHEVSGRKMHEDCYHEHMREINERHRHTIQPSHGPDDDRRAKALAGRLKSQL